MIFCTKLTWSNNLALSTAKASWTMNMHALTFVRSLFSEEERNKFSHNHGCFVFQQYDPFLDKWSIWMVYAVIWHFVIWPNLIYRHILSKCWMTKCWKKCNIVLSRGFNLKTKKGGSSTTGARNMPSHLLFS